MNCQYQRNELRSQDVSIKVNGGISEVEEVAWHTAKLNPRGSKNRTAIAQSACSIFETTPTSLLHSVRFSILRPISSMNASSTRLLSPDGMLPKQCANSKPLLTYMTRKWKLFTVKATHSCMPVPQSILQATVRKSTAA